MTGHLNKHKSKKKINQPTLCIFYLILYCDKFRIAFWNSLITKKIRKFIGRIRDIVHWHLKHPDLYFEDKWETNEFYPFHVDQFEQFVLNVRDRWFYPVAVLFLCATIFGIIRASSDVNDILTHIVIIVSGIYAFILRTKQHLIIDQGAEEYVIIWYNTILFSEPIHNIYLRIHEVSKSPADPSYYQLVIQATKLPPVSLTRLSTDDERIRRIGHILSEKINLNFFEFEDLSHNHVIRHWPEIPPDDETNISPPPKTDFFQMKSMRAIFHAGSGLAIRSFYEFERMLTGSQLSKKGSEQMSYSSISTVKSSLLSADRKTSWRKKPFKFFRKMFPTTNKRNTQAETSVESDLDRPGTSGAHGSPSRFSDGTAPSLSKRVSHRTSSVDAFNQREFLRELHRKIQSAQAESSDEEEEPASYTSRSETSIPLDSTESETDNEMNVEHEV